MTERLLDYFVRSLERSPANKALWVNAGEYSYSELADIAAGIASAVHSAELSPGGFVGILAHRSLPAFAGILGSLMSGRGYVPLNPKFPGERGVIMLERAGVEAVVLDCEQLDTFGPVLHAMPTSLLVVCLGNANTAQLRQNFPKHRFIQAHPQSPATSMLVPSVKSDDIAYLLFTSGSTGEPKGVPIHHEAVCHYIDNIITLYSPTANDRFSQTFDLTFDLSVHDVFAAWGSGAQLFVLPDRFVMAPAKFIRDHQLTFWFSVPSTVAFMNRFRMLKAGAFPSLRCSLFCGEALPVASAARWHEAAPNSRVDNLYGPTEATIAFTTYRYEPGLTEDLAENGIVPIGSAMPGLQTAILDPEGHLLPQGEVGELALGGPQLSQGYWKDPHKTADRFLNVSDGKASKRWYRTGDRARLDSEKGLVFLGRLDNQIKILGHRVELGEIEHVVRREAASSDICVIPWPVTDEGAGGVIAFVAGYEGDTKALLERCRNGLPEYMVPKEILTPERLPLNANGKVDRNALRASLEEEREKENA